MTKNDGKELNVKVEIPGCSYKVTLLEAFNHINSYKVLVVGKDVEGVRFLTYGQIKGTEPIDWNFSLLGTSNLVSNTKQKVRRDKSRNEGR